MSWVYLSGLTEVLVGPVDNPVEQFFPMHQVNIADTDVFSTPQHF